jgi:hypothetical protein
MISGPASPAAAKPRVDLQHPLQQPKRINGSRSNKIYVLRLKPYFAIAPALAVAGRDAALFAAVDLAMLVVDERSWAVELRIYLCKGRSTIQLL